MISGSCITHRPSRRQRGFGLTDALIGLLMLSMALLAAATTLLRALHTQRATEFQLRAAGLAADLGERLAAIHSPEAARATIGRWSEEALAGFPPGSSLDIDMSGTPEAGLPHVFSVRLSWPVSGSRQRLVLPVAAHAVAPS